MGRSTAMVLGVKQPLYFVAFKIKRLDSSLNARRPIFFVILKNILVLSCLLSPAVN